MDIILLGQFMRVMKIDRQQLIQSYGTVGY
jgi:hypothetical protein